MFNKLIYVAPHPGFFTGIPGGQVTHVEGILNGFESLFADMELMCDIGAQDFKHRFPNKLVLKEHTLKSFVTRIKLAYKVAKLSRESHKQLILIRKEPVFLAMLIFFRLFLWGKKSHIAIEVNGLIFDFKQKQDKSVLLTLSGVVHKILLSFFDSVYVVNHDLKDRLVNGIFNLDADKVFAIHNGGPEPISDEKLSLSGLNVKEKKILFYGILNSYNDFELIVDCIKTWNIDSNQKIIFEIIGFGPLEEQIEKYSKESEFIKYLGRKDFSELRDYLESERGSTNYFGLVPFRVDNGSKSLSPIKAFEYMALGIPVIKSDNCLDGIINNGINGFEYIKSNKLDFIKVLNIIHELDFSQYRNMELETLKESKKHTWNSRMKELYSDIESCEFKTGNSN